LVFLKALLSVGLFLVLLIASNFFWEIQHRKSFLRTKMWDEATLRRLIALANDPTGPNGTYASRFPRGMFADGPPALGMAALLGADLQTTGGVRNLILGVVVVVGIVAFVAFSWIGLAEAAAVFVAMRFTQLSRSGKNSAYEKMVQITDALYAWHWRDPGGVVKWLDSVPGFQPAYRVLKADVLDKESGEEGR
jgi:hypothetical protein